MESYEAMPVSCNTCHDSHRTFDFENDGPDYALRNPDPSDLVLAPGIIVLTSEMPATIVSLVTSPGTAMKSQLINTPTGLM